MSKNIAIIGGGIIGLSSAYYLHKSGHKVTVFDSGEFKDGCSYHNMGMIVPSHFIPLASPGIISKGIRWMFDSTSPFYIRPRLDANLLKWGLKFYRSATKENVEQARPALRDISLLSRSLYQSLSKELPFDFCFKDRGLMMLYNTIEAEREEEETAQIANSIGINAQILSADEAQELEPNVKLNVRGGVLYPGDAQLTPQKFVSGLWNYLGINGIEFIGNVKIADFDISNGKVNSINSLDQKWSFDEVVIAAGSWSENLGRKLQIRLPVQPGKGYSFLVGSEHKKISLPSILVEARVAVAPMGDFIRFGGTMELSGFDSNINMKRVEGIAKSIPSYYPDLKIETPLKKEVWCGFRPCSPDGLPYIGRLDNLSNVVMATGHAMMGMSLGPATGKLVSEIVNEEHPAISIKPFYPERFG